MRRPQSKGIVKWTGVRFSIAKSVGAGPSHPMAGRRVRRRMLIDEDIGDA